MTHAAGTKRSSAGTADVLAAIDTVLGDVTDQVPGVNGGCSPPKDDHDRADNHGVVPAPGTFPCQGSPGRSAQAPDYDEPAYVLGYSPFDRTGPLRRWLRALVGILIVIGFGTLAVLVLTGVPW